MRSTPVPPQLFTLGGADVGVAKHARPEPNRRVWLPPKHRPRTADENRQRPRTLRPFRISLAEQTHTPPGPAKAGNREAAATETSPSRLMYRKPRAMQPLCSPVPHIWACQGQKPARDRGFTHIRRRTCSGRRGCRTNREGHPGSSRPGESRRKRSHRSLPVLGRAILGSDGKAVDSPCRVLTRPAALAGTSRSHVELTHDRDRVTPGGAWSRSPVLVSLR